MTSASVIEEISFGSASIKFHLLYSSRKSLGITVTPDGAVWVKAPISASVSSIREKVIKRAAWIIKQRRFFESFQPRSSEKKYVGGETHLYLGRQYRLKIASSENISDRTSESVKIKGGFILVATRIKSRIAILLKDWYLQKAKLIFHTLAKPLIEKFKRLRVSPASIVIRHMNGRWGSCTPKGKIILNPELIRAPKGCVDYVILHELCHLKYHDHSRKFTNLLAREMPDWEKWKNKLERLLA